MKTNEGKLLAAATMCLMLAVGACALIGDPIAEKVADVIDDYCKEPYQARQLYRDTINSELAPLGHSIEVTCIGDPAPTP